MQYIGKYFLYIDFFVKEEAKKEEGIIGFLVSRFKNLN